MMEGSDFSVLHRLDDRVAVITGAAHGIGLATAKALGQFGATVVATDVDSAAIEIAVDDLRVGGIDAHGLHLDVSDESSITTAIDATVDRHKRLDILVANAGTGARSPAESMTSDDWRRVVSINLDGTFYCCRAAGQVMLEQGSGAIVIVSSIMGLVGGGLYPNAAYQTTKGGLVNMARTLALEWAPHVRVNTVAPTFARTRLTERLLEDGDMEQAILDNTPMGRLVEPEEVAAAIAFLASDAASMITGTTLPVDGGWVAR